MENQLIPLKLHSSTFCNRDDYEDEDGYNNWSEEVETSYLFVSQAKTQRETNFLLPKSEKYFLVYETYSHGDSFGNSNGNTLEIELFNNEEQAKLFLSILENFYLAYHYEFYGKTPKNKQTIIKQHLDFLNKNTEVHSFESFIFEGKIYNLFFDNYEHNHCNFYLEELEFKEV